MTPDNRTLRVNHRRKANNAGGSAARRIFPSNKAAEIAVSMESKTIESDSDTESTAPAADGIGVWEQAYCVVCDCLIEPHLSAGPDEAQLEMAAISPLRSHANALRAPVTDDVLFGPDQRPIYCSDKCKEADNARSTGLQELVHYMNPSTDNYLRYSARKHTPCGFAQSMPVYADTFPQYKEKPSSFAAARGWKMPSIRVDADTESPCGSPTEISRPLSPLRLGETLPYGAHNDAMSNLQRTWAQRAPQMLKDTSSAENKNFPPVQTASRYSQDGSIQRSRQIRSMSPGTAECAATADTPESEVFASVNDFSPHKDGISAIEQLKQTQARTSSRSESMSDNGPESATFLSSLSSMLTSMIGSPGDNSAVNTPPQEPTKPKPVEKTRAREQLRRIRQRDVEVLPPIFGLPAEQRSRLGSSASSLNAPIHSQRSQSLGKTSRRDASEDSNSSRRSTASNNLEPTSRVSKHLSLGAHPTAALSIPGTSPRRAGLGWSALHNTHSDRAGLAGSAHSAGGTGSSSPSSWRTSRSWNYGSRTGVKMYPILQLPGEVHDTYNHYWDDGGSVGNKRGNGGDSHASSSHAPSNVQAPPQGRRKSLFHFDYV